VTEARQVTPTVGLAANASLLSGAKEINRSPNKDTARPQPVQPDNSSLDINLYLAVDLLPGILAFEVGI
jgi:hypothetical protein